MVQERKGEAVKPVALLQMMEKFGPTRTAKQLGVSTTTLYKARNGNIVSKSIELAASALIGPPTVEQAQPATHGKVEKLIPQLAADSDKIMLIMEVPKSKAELLKRVALQFGAEVES
jgi:hypothetical protein